MENKLKIPNYLYVYCTNSELTIRVLQLVDSLGYKWDDGSSYLDYKISYCYYNFNRGTYTRIKQSLIITDIEFLKLHNMEERTVKISLDKAKEFYKQGGSNKELALLAFTEEELNDDLLVPDNIPFFKCGTSLGLGFNNKQFVYSVDNRDVFYTTIITSCIKKCKCKLIECDRDNLKSGDIYVVCNSSVKIAPKTIGSYNLCLKNKYLNMNEFCDEIRLFPFSGCHHYYYKVVPVNG